MYFLNFTPLFIQVLAHRWGHWTTLQWVGRILWDQSSTLVLMVERVQSADAINRQLTMEQIYTVITPLLVLASDLLMDMMEKLKVKLYISLNLGVY